MSIFTSFASFTSRARWLSVLLPLAFCCAANPVEAQQNNLSDAQLRQEMTLALSGSEVSLGHAQPSIKPRTDLEELVYGMKEKETPKKVYFYQVDSSGDDLGTTATSIAAVVHSTGAINQLFSFEGSREFGAFAEEFNRLASSLVLSITKNEAVSLAKLFLESSRAGNPGSILADDVGLKLAVQNFYWSAYQDVWKMLDAYSRWWTPFQADMPELGPKVAVNPEGDYDLSLHTLLTVDGKHPQVQQIELTISPAGMVQVRSIRTIFPDRSRWMFYDFPLPRPETWR